mmetsp:Transcript_10066/g.28859  ORF Transcript_10066/g.28859 Transcript_10066/m.28859 type:complete len:92 (-) Transcript_10066:285-560(-)
MCNKKRARQLQDLPGLFNCIGDGFANMLKLCNSSIISILWFLNQNAESSRPRGKHLGSLPETLEAWPHMDDVKVTCASFGLHPQFFGISVN